MEAGRILIDYTGNRVRAGDVAKFDNARDRLSIPGNTQVHVPSEGSVIDPAGVGNDTCYVNHFFEPNCQLQKIDVTGRTVFSLVSLCHISAGAELGCYYGFQSGLTAEPVKCFCRSAKCEGTI